MDACEVDLYLIFINPTLQCAVYARPRNTRPLEGQTLQIRGFELGPKIFKTRGFSLIFTKFSRYGDLVKD